MPDRKMKGYVVMADPLDRKRTMLTQWVQRSLAFTRSLPPKAKNVAGREEMEKGQTLN
jgi:hypothetical protein